MKVKKIYEHERGPSTALIEGDEEGDLFEVRSSEGKNEEKKEIIRWTGFLAMSLADWEKEVINDQTTSIAVRTAIIYARFEPIYSDEGIKDAVGVYRVKPWVEISAVQVHHNTEYLDRNPPMFNPNLPVEKVKELGAKPHRVTIDLASLPGIPGFD